jgi:hypothetical protein
MTGNRLTSIDLNNYTDAPSSSGNCQATCQDHTNDDNTDIW